MNLYFVYLDQKIFKVIICLSCFYAPVDLKESLKLTGESPGENGSKIWGFLTHGLNSLSHSSSCSRAVFVVALINLLGDQYHPAVPVPWGVCLICWGLWANAVCHCHLAAGAYESHGRLHFPKKKKKILCKRRLTRIQAKRCVLVVQVCWVIQGCFETSYWAALLRSHENECSRLEESIIIIRWKKQFK